MFFTNNMLKLISSFILLFCVMNGNAQNIRALLQAELYYYKEAYYSAAKMYEQYLYPPKNSQSTEGLKIYKNIGKGKVSINSKTLPSGSDIIFKVADAYRLSYYFNEAVNNYAKALKQDQKKYADALLWMAVCKRNLGQLDSSKILLNQYISHSDAKDSLKIRAIEELATIEFIEKQMKRKDTSLFIVTQADQTPGRGYFSIRGQSNAAFIVSGSVPTGTDSKVPAQYLNRLFTATIANKMVTPGELLNIESMDVNQNQHTGVLSKNGNLIYFTQWNNVNGKPVSKIFYSRKKDNNVWGVPVLLPLINEGESNQKHPYITDDGNTLYYASNRQGGKGKFDIWYATLDKDGMPAALKNAGDIINTTEDEAAPYFHSLSNTLVYSSNGGSGMGGYDFYFSKEQNGSWTTPENAGYPINSNRDDLFFYATGTTLLQSAYVSSDRNSDCCLQLFHIEKLPKKKILNGKLMDCKTTQPLSEAQLTTESGIQTKTNADGSYSFEVNENASNNMIISFEKDKYVKKSFNAVLSVDDSDPLITQLTPELMCLEQVFVPEPVVVKKEEVAFVNFDFNKSDLLESNAAVLDSFYVVLRNNPTYTVKIDAHTDSKGTEKYNNKLSNRRASAVASFFLKKGIDKSRVIFEGFGKCCPLEPEVVNGVYNKEAAKRNRRALIHISKN